MPVADVRKNPAHLKLLEDWLRSYKPEELFDANGTVIPEIRELAPTGTRRMGANPHANGGLLKKNLRLPDFRDYGVKFDKPGQTEADNMRPLGVFLRDVMKLEHELVSRFSALTKRRPTGSTRYMKSARSFGSPSTFLRTAMAASSRATEESLKC